MRESRGVGVRGRGTRERESKVVGQGEWGCSKEV